MSCDENSYELLKNLVEGSSKEAVINRNITVHGLEGGATINPTPKK